MKNIWLTFSMLLLGGMLSVSAQITDSSSPSTSIPAVSNPDHDSSSALDIKPLNNSGLTNPNPNKVNGMSVPNRSSGNGDSQFSMFEKEKFGNPGEQYERRVQREADALERKPDEKLVGKTTDQYLGDFKTKGKKVTIAYRDYSAVDGDRIRIFVDGMVVRSNVTLGGTFSTFELDLVDGFNKVDFQALNQGDSGPNTAELLIVDEGGNVLASKYWALATGVKATVIVVKE